MSRQYEIDRPGLDIQDPLLPKEDVIIYDELNFLAPGVVVFPGLQNTLIHGFAWGDGIPNYSYIKEPGYPDESSIDAVKIRIQEFLEKMGSEYKRRVIFQSLVHEEEILDIDLEYLSTRPADTRGTYTEGGAFFTKEAGIPFTSTAGDCRYAIIHADSPGGPLTGIVHGSRNQLDRRLPQRAINHLIYNYGISPESIRAGITP